MNYLSCLFVCCFIIGPYVSLPGSAQSTGIRDVETRGGDFHFAAGSTHSCLSKADRAAIWSRLPVWTGPAARFKAAIPALTSPVRMRDTLPGFQHAVAISNYVDHDPAEDRIRDFACRELSYDGHQGTDWFTFPFPWHLYEKDAVEVVAAAPGTIIGKDDGQFDRQCEWKDNVQWNAVYIRHEDGSTAWYGHLKKGSLTGKDVGETVGRGEYLGVIASSGRSDGPHLHFELYDRLGRLQDPYRGDCNTRSTTSRWVEQPMYAGPQINAVLTQSDVPAMQCGPEVEVSALSNGFLPGDRMYVGTYLTNYAVGEQAVTKVFDARGTLAFDFVTEADQHYGWLYSYVWVNLDEGVAQGTWRAEATLNGQRVTHHFRVGVGTVSTGTEPGEANITLSPNPTHGTVELRGKLGGAYTYRLYTASGQLLTVAPLTSTEIDLGIYPTGAYYLQLIGTDGVRSLGPVLKR